MGALAVQGIGRSFGAVRAVDDVSLSVAQGGFVCFLGPSGCGKTTLLRVIAGLEDPDAGRVLLDGRDITRRPTHRRRFGVVFQSLALFPHLSVGDNIAYSLRLRGVGRADRRRRVAELLDLVRLPDVSRRGVNQLSGGQRQRVAIARALAMEPAVLLLDEPLSALDAKLREAMQVELRLLQQRLKITTVLVTHDQREAMTMADLIVVMADGRVQQVGPPLEVYAHPANRFVADFIGLNNLLPARVVGRDAVLFADRVLKVAAMPADARDDDEVTLAVRPETIRLTRPNGADAPEGTVTFVRDVGNQVETHVECAGRRIVSVTAPQDGHGLRPGQRAALGLTPDACRVLTA